MKVVNLFEKNKLNKIRESLESVYSEMDIVFEKLAEIENRAEKLEEEYNEELLNHLPRVTLEDISFATNFEFVENTEKSLRVRFESGVEVAFNEKGERLQ